MAFFRWLSSQLRWRRSSMIAASSSAVLRYQSMPCCWVGGAAGAGSAEVETATGISGFLTAAAFLAWGRLMVCGLWKAVGGHESWFKARVRSSSGRYQVLSCARPLPAPR
jgi:hypothetical protein